MPISPNKATFDGTNLLISVAPGEMEIDTQVDLYSAWKDWVKQADNAKYPQAFRTIGGDSLGGVLRAGSYYFLQNELAESPSRGWRIRPAELDHELVISGNLFAEDTNVPVFVPTLGDFTVTIRLNTSSLTQLASVTQDVAALTLDQDARLARIEQLLRNKHILDPVGGRERIYADDGGSPILEADAFEDAAGTVRYGVNSARVERRERFEPPGP